jgi:hypothetical protein
MDNALLATRPRSLLIAPLLAALPLALATGLADAAPDPAMKADGKEPAVIAICGIGPITFHNSEPGTPGWRKV